MVASVFNVPSVDDASKELVTCTMECTVNGERGMHKPLSFPTNVDPQHHQQRHVTFLIDELDRDLVEVLEYELPPEETLFDQYWSNEEKLGFFNEARRQVIQFVRQSPDQVAELETAFYKCSGDMHATGTAPQFGDEHDKGVLLHSWVTSNERGLEDAVTQVFSNERREYIRRVIVYAAALYEHAARNDMHVPDELCRYSEPYARRSRAFAYKMALADDLVR